jgi:molecular chaperone DnaK
MKAASDHLQKLGAELYAKAQEAGAAAGAAPEGGPSADSNASSGGSAKKAEKKADVVDADFEVVDDDKKKK